ncbi:MAG: alpha-L-rhamnosidase N-terminal domain-containing protein, partial [Kiritimatiellae bacterium]|nr:alpha-L-rhamnosidase N-terminal domain-containing protein [Kiritimatiellia bacterium]
MKVTDLRCEYHARPMGLDARQPRLGWALEADVRGARQTACRILVASSPDILDGHRGDLWDSGKVMTTRTQQIAYAGEPLAARQQCWWKVCVWDQDGQRTPWSAAEYWSMGLLESGDWQAQWIGLDEALAETELAKPRYLRRSFSVPAKVRRAVVYVTALGLYELRLNGRRVGEALLTPEWTNYHRRVQYQTYDVTSLLNEGDNAIGAMLGNGWYCGLWQCWPPKAHLYGNHPLLLTQLEIEYADGQRQLIASDDAWRGTSDGPL